MSNEKRFKVGDKSVVVRKTGTHGFKIGEEVLVTFVDDDAKANDLPYECCKLSNPSECYWVSECDLSSDDIACTEDIPIGTYQYIQDLLQLLGELEADKAELLEAFTDVLSRFPSEFTGIYDKTIRRGILTAPISDIEQWRTLIQKHAAK